MLINGVQVNQELITGLKAGIELYKSRSVNDAMDLGDIDETDGII
jgi:hypothetical protein